MILASFFRITCCSFYIRTGRFPCCCTCTLRRWRLSLNLMNQRLPASDFFFFIFLNSLSIELGRVRPWSRFGFDLREFCGWFDLPSRQVKLFSVSAIKLFCFLTIHVFSRIGITFLLLLCCKACEILISRPGIEFGTLTVKVSNPNH